MRQCDEQVLATCGLAVAPGGKEAALLLLLDVSMRCSPARMRAAWRLGAMCARACALVQQPESGSAWPDGFVEVFEQDAIARKS